jgi:hypothetical protein
MFLSHSFNAFSGVLNDFSDPASRLFRAVSYAFILSQAVATALAEEHHLELERGHHFLYLFLLLTKAFAEAFGVGGVLGEAGFEYAASFGISKFPEGSEALFVFLHGCFNDFPDFWIHVIKNIRGE